MTDKLEQENKELKQTLDKIKEWVKTKEKFGTSWTEELKELLKEKEE